MFVYILRATYTEALQPSLPDSLSCVLSPQEPRSENVTGKLFSTDASSPRPEHLTLYLI